MYFKGAKLLKNLLVDNVRYKKNVSRNTVKWSYYVYIRYNTKPYLGVTGNNAALLRGVGVTLVDLSV